jgi:hypothetical protein
MPMRILVWNIKFFSEYRIVGQGGSTAALTDADARRAMASLIYIVSTVVAAQPDIFVVTEPRATPGQPGELADANSGGPAGLRTLLTQLQQWVAPTWYLVPPVRINTTQTPVLKRKDRNNQVFYELGAERGPYTECIGVFWDNAKVNFTGPWVHTATGIAAGGAGVAYPAPWNATVPALPAPTTAAGQAVFTKASGSALNFPDFNSRKPFRTTFVEAVGATPRTLDLYSVHNEVVARAAGATNSLRSLPFDKLTPHRMTLVAGDFNLNLTGLGGEKLIAVDALGGWLGIKLQPPSWWSFGMGRTRYDPTSVLSATYAEPGAYHTETAYDYAFLNYAPLARPAAPFAPSLAIVDRVAGTPNPPFDSDMAQDLGNYAAMPGGGVDVFKRRYNFAHIGTPAYLDTEPAVYADGTSDHLPILLEI